MSTVDTLDVVAELRLTEQAVVRMLAAAVEEARNRSAPSSVAIVDATGLLRAFILMNGAAPVAQQVVPKKARTAASTGAPTGGAMDPAIAARIAAAAEDFTDLPGGFPIVVNGVVVGGIGASGSSADNDVAVARAGLAAFAGTA